MKKTMTLAATLALTTTLANAADLTVDIYNPGADAIFPVTSAVIAGPSEVMLVDAQFDKASAQDVLKMLQDTGKELTTIYISHGDPDFYFGLDVITAAYPDAEIVATPTTIAHINNTKEAKVAFWGPILGDNAPSKVIVPTEISGATFTVDGESVEIVGLDGHDPKHTFVWVPSAKTVVGGVLLYENLHVWMADANTVEEQDKWQKSLDVIRNIGADRIVPSHYLGETAGNLDAVNFTSTYVTEIAAAAAKLDGSEALIGSMTASYPDFPNVGDLEIGAKVLEGEMEW